MTSPNRCRVEWTMHGKRLMLGAFVDWSDPMVRVDVREDARLVASAMGDVEIVDHTGAWLDTVRVPR